MAAPVLAFTPPLRGTAASLSSADGARPPEAGQTQLPTDVCYGARVGIRSCAEQRYVAAFARGASATQQADAGLDLEVSGFHPFRQADAADRVGDCPSEWVILQFGHRQHRGPVRLGDEVCFAKELSAGRRERYAYLGLAPAPGGDAMEPAIERGEGTDLCRWTLVNADAPDGMGTLRAGVPVLIRGKYNECLSLGRRLYDPTAPSTSTGSSFRSPVRSSGRGLVCQGRDSKAPKLRFRIVKAGIPVGLDAAPRVPAPPPSDLRTDADVASLGGWSVQEQERALLEDVLYAFLGVDGVYVRRVAGAPPRPPDGRSAPPLAAVRFEVRPPAGTDTSVAQFVERLLPLCEHHAAVQGFVEAHGQYEYGAVNHALCAALRGLLREFAVRVGQLETELRSGPGGGGLSLAWIWHQLQPSMDTFALLHRVASHVHGRTGGPVLNGIEEVMARSSLTAAQDLCEFLLQQASRPYFEMVSKWVYEGKLEDHYGEFFISENPRVRDERFGGPAADFWQKHFVLEEHSVPQFLGASKEKILHAGKYLHVFFSAAPHAELPQTDADGIFKYSRRRKDYTEAIDAAYRRASAALLGLFMRPQPDGLDLRGRLRSMRSFFFLAKADWFGQLMDMATAELEQPAADVPIARLEGLLDMAIRTSSAASDPYRDDITCGMHSFRIEDACHRMSKGQDLDADAVAPKAAGPAFAAGGPGRSAAGPPGSSPGGGAGPSAPVALNIAGDNSGVRCVTLKYRTSWPLSIVFSKSLLLKYQVIFRHLLYCRYVERKLVEVWVDHQYTKELGLDTSFSPSYSLRQRMLHFCRDYIYYATVEVLEPQSHRFLASLGQAEAIDEVLQSHESFLDLCLREILLTEREGLYRHLSKVLQTCLTFAYNLHRFSHNFHDTARDDAGSSSQVQQSPAAKRLARVRQSTQAYLSLLSQRHYSKMISKFKMIFESQLQGFLRQMQQESTTRYEHFLSNLATRLDYNEYYSSVLAEDAAPSPPEAESARS